MSKYVTCCPKCLEMISKTSTDAGCFWMELCAYSLDKPNHLFLLNCHEQILRIICTLENLGYVVSTEDFRKKSDSDGTGIFIKVLGHQKLTHDVELFCRGDHEK